MTGCWGRLFSIALQNGMSLDKLIVKHKGMRFDPCGLTDNKDVPICTSIPDYVVRWLEHEFKDRIPHSEDLSKSNVSSGVYCPECGGLTVYKDGCVSCASSSCGWTRCG
jgi:hypothetical protein